jgi:exodeoxyribonuclease V alpha subunit
VRETLRRAIENPGKRPVLAERDGLIGLAKLISQEEFIADRLMSMIGTPPWGRRKDLEAVVKEAEADVGMSLATQQRAAVLMALSHRVSIMTGGPGVGKTATTRVILSALKAIKCRVVLAAPTGKAAKRASEATGHPASTIHRLLGMVGKPSDDGADEPKPEHIDADVVVIDEMSMTDVPLMTQIVAAIGRKTALLMIGDVDQLPSVGPGRVLQDLIDSGRIPVTRLTEVFRQAAGSYIITNAHRINTGQMPVAGGPESDFFVLDDRNVGALREATDLSAGDVAKVAANLVLDLVCDRLPSKYGFDPVRDIQVLTPMRKGDAGVQALNEALQRRLLPEGLPFVARGFNRFHVGDKVIQTRNNYDLDIFNGDMGIVLKVDPEEDEVVVEIDGRQVLLEGSALDDLQLAYALTVHKVQGSQFPAIVFPMLTQHWMMLKRNLIYTGVTRAQKLAVLVGQSKAIAAAVRTKDSSLRLTRLEHLLKAAS